MVSQARVVFHGRVQGVWFRAFTSEQAKTAQLTGWVRNLANGSVEALFEGDRDKIEVVIEKCRQGPPSALVENTDIAWEQASGDFTSFKVRG